MSVEKGLKVAAKLIKEICGGEISKIDIQKTEKFKLKNIKFELELLEKTLGFKISIKEITKILENLGFKVKKNRNFLDLQVPSWRPDIEQPIDIVEELIRIYGYGKIKKIDPIKTRDKSTLNETQKMFHFLQRSVASKGFQEAITWSFTDSDTNNLFKNDKKNIEILNPISSELNVLRNSIFSNLITYLNKNLDRGIKDISLFEIGPVFFGINPGDQETVLGALRSGKVSRMSWIEKEREIDIFDIKRDVIQTLVEAGNNRSDFFIDDKVPNYYHPGKAGRIFLSKEKNKVAAYFGEIHPSILKKKDVKTEALVGFEIFLNNLEFQKKSLKDKKDVYKASDYQKSERDFAFIINKNFRSQDLIELVYNIDKELIKNVDIFDVYEGDNIPDNKKSIALNVTIQSMSKTLKESDLEKINKLIIETVEKETGAIIRS